MSLKAVYIDTNIFLHYKSFDEINWLNIIDADRIEIRVPSVVISELDKHKYSSSSKLRNKAGRVIKKLHQLIDNGLTTNLKPNIDITFEINDDIANYESLGLNPNSQDDRLLASILSYQEANTEVSIVLIAADLGIRLKAKVHQIEAISLPDELKLSVELDQSEKYIKQLERELLELKRITPDLKLCFSDDSNKLKLDLKEGMPSNFDIAETVNKSVQNIKEKYPKLPEPESVAQAPKPSKILLSNDHFGSDKPEILPHEVLDYNKYLDGFYEQYEQYLREYINWRDVLSRSYLVEICIINDGTCSAQDIDIHMHFPDGFTLSEISDFPKKPEEPKPCSQPVPRTREDRIRKLSVAMPQISIPKIPLSAHLQDRTSPNVSSSDIRRTNSYDVNIHVLKLKQNTSESFDLMILIFESSDLVSRFHIDYKINAENVPKPVIGKLHVMFAKSDD